MDLTLEMKDSIIDSLKNPNKFVIATLPYGEPECEEEFVKYIK